MTNLQDTLMKIYEALLARFGPQYWWPADTPTEVAIGAVLTQNTNWKNVAIAIEAMRKNGMLDFAVIEETNVDMLAQCIRSAGYYNLKAQRLQNLAAFVRTALDGEMERLAARPIDRARNALLSVNGIGPETADSILLYACGQPTFVVDAYTKRVLRRHGLIEPTATYDDVKTLFETHLPNRADLFNEYHALIVALCKDHCRTIARCAACPLAFHPHDEYA